jgi:hypothetical protein
VDALPGQQTRATMGRAVVFSAVCSEAAKDVSLATATHATVEVFSLASVPRLHGRALVIVCTVCTLW